MDNNLTRSHALNNIPKLKVSSKITDLLQSCEVCSKRTPESISSIDGACQKCSLTIVIYNRYQEANIPIDYWDLKMDERFFGDPRLRTKYNEYVVDLKKSYTDGASICFASGHGRGKTFTATAILKKACQKGYTCLYADLSSIISVLTQASSEEKYLARKELILVDFLVVDEADMRYFNQSDASSDLFGRSFESIIRARIQNKLPVILATNSPNYEENFHALFKDSIGSLMNKIPTFIVFGDDHRNVFYRKLIELDINGVIHTVQFAVSRRKINKNSNDIDKIYSQPTADEFYENIAKSPEIQKIISENKDVFGHQEFLFHAGRGMRILENKRYYDTLPYLCFKGRDK